MLRLIDGELKKLMTEGPKVEGICEQYEEKIEISS